MKMNGKLRVKSLVALILSIVIVVATATTADAGTSTKSGSVSNVSVRAEKTIIQYSNRWNAVIRSLSFVQPIGTIGYTSWTIQQKCGSTTTFYQQNPGDVNYSASEYYDGRTVYYGSCSPGSLTMINTGTHDFKQGSSTWRPPLTRTETR